MKVNIPFPWILRLIFSVCQHKHLFPNFYDRGPSATNQPWKPTSGKRSHRFRTGSWKARTKGTWIRCSSCSKVLNSLTFLAPLCSNPFCTRGFGVLFLGGTQTPNLTGYLGTGGIKISPIDIQNWSDIYKRKQSRSSFFRDCRSFFFSS